MIVDSLPNEEQWEQQLKDLIAEHFQGARTNIDGVYREHFASLSATLQRHWQHRADVPRDLLNLPRGLWRAGRNLVGKRASKKEGKETDASPSLSLKEQAIEQVLIHHLLHLPLLEQKIIQHLRQHPGSRQQQWKDLDELLGQYKDEGARLRLQEALSRLTITQEGGRDAMLFITLGVVSRGMAENIAFGSAMGIGSAAASSIYIGQQSFFGALWAGWFGPPGWVTLAGAGVGLSVIILSTPLISPFVEYGVNKWRARNFLADAIDRVEQDMISKKIDGVTLAAQLSTYVQLLPELLSLLRSLR